MCFWGTVHSRARARAQIRFDGFRQWCTKVQLRNERELQGNFGNRGGESVFLFLIFFTDKILIRRYLAVGYSGYGEKFYKIRKRMRRNVREIRDLLEIRSLIYFFFLRGSRSRDYYNDNSLLFWYRGYILITSTISLSRTTRWITEHSCTYLLYYRLSRVTHDWRACSRIHCMNYCSLPNSGYPAT